MTKSYVCTQKQKASLPKHVQGTFVNLIRHEYEQGNLTGRIAQGDLVYRDTPENQKQVQAALKRVQAILKPRAEIDFPWELVDQATWDYLEELDTKKTEAAPPKAKEKKPEPKPEEQAHPAPQGGNESAA